MGKAKRTHQKQSTDLDGYEVHRYHFEGAAAHTLAS
jgi:hypothetical protein